MENHKQSVLDVISISDIETSDASILSTDTSQNAAKSVGSTLMEQYDIIHSNVTVTSMNDAPAVSGAIGFAVDEDGFLLINEVDLLVNASDIDGDILSIENLVADGVTVTNNLDGTWTFYPAADFTGRVNLTYDVSDGTVTTPATGSISVTVANNVPVVSGPTTSTVAEDNSVTVTEAELLANSTDVDGDILNITNVAVTGVDASVVDNGNGTWTITPVGDFNGSIALTYGVSDGTAAVQGSMDVTVTAVNDAPAAESSVISLVEGHLVSGQLTGTDAEGDALSYAMVTAPGEGSLSINADGSYTYEPPAGFLGETSFEYRVTDEHGLSAVETVHVHVGGGDGAGTTSVSRNTTELYNPLLWLDASDETTFVDANADGFIEGWNDKSGNNKHGTQSNTINMPTYDSNAFNGVGGVGVGILDIRYVTSVSLFVT